MPYFPNVLLLHLVPLDHRFSLEETAVFVVVESLLAEKLGLLFSLCVLQVLFVFGYPFLLLFLGCAVVLIHFLQDQNKASLSTTVTQGLGTLPGSSSAIQFMKGTRTPLQNQQNHTYSWPCSALLPLQLYQDPHQEQKKWPLNSLILIFSPLA